MGLYFSYFKTMIDADSVPDGLHRIMRDNITEFPSTINTLKRFNLYPEVTLGLAYRCYQSLSDFFGYRTKQCWQVNRGEGLSPVLSCEGLGEPSYFYTEAVFALNGLLLGLFFLFGTYLSGSLIGGITTASCYIFNHGECTRVMWTSPLRESFGYPFFVLQMYLATIVLRNKSTEWKYSLMIAAAQIPFMLSWQFAQFALLTQTLAIFGVYVLQLIPKSNFIIVISGQTVGLLISYVMLFGNAMLFTSFFACALIAVWGLAALEKTFKALHYRILIMLSQVISFFTMLFLSKVVMGKLFHLEDDAHIAEIFRSKFSDFQNFHTMLYTCAKEFDFIETETLWKLLKTVLIPTASVVLVFIIVQLVYHALQTLAFTAMALLIMRLKLFWTPQLCLMSSLVASRQLFGWGKKEIHFAVVAGLLACMAFSGSANIKHELSILGEFSNYPQEELVEWINGKTPQDAVFAGSMPTMATVKLCTQRPIVNHPHYEDAGLRERTKTVYTVYSRKPIEQVKTKLESLGVQYLVLEDSWCRKRSRPGCSLPEIWDIEDSENQGKQPVCIKMQKKPEPHFKTVFENVVYKVLKLT
ncbi:protein dpy-19-like 1-like protein [Plakobranchus ocellatus]|uniref:Protein dpy-19-like 1-like protein n=1 Tax=Plakobranchus ocellatus TaxID=259542 RepID=A0AAV4BAF3_9GAST|nr:protein dpy-19-like 1-like protein [Plakobranchus ocellatus]